MIRRSVTRQALSSPCDLCGSMTFRAVGHKWALPTGLSPHPLKGDEARKDAERGAGAE